MIEGYELPDFDVLSYTVKRDKESGSRWVEAKIITRIEGREALDAIMEARDSWARIDLIARAVAFQATGDGMVRVRDGRRRALRVSKRRDLEDLVVGMAIGIGAGWVSAVIGIAAADGMEWTTAAFFAASGTLLVLGGYWRLWGYRGSANAGEEES